MRKVLIIDTSLFCVWLQIPGMEYCGTDNDKWDYQRVNNCIQEEIRQGTILVLPLATLIETGNHIAKANTKRRETAQALAKIMNYAADETSPWMAFGEQFEVWGTDKLKELAAEWPDKATEKISIGDATIKKVGDFYATKKDFQVEFLTAEKQLKAQEPPPKTQKKRRSGN